ncbi:glycosyltransferase family 4 protein [candidate division KSB1 bacterium]|nr:glycosyltransferase family 4 protein [candidate division KSB1 bacterium]
MKISMLGTLPPLKGISYYCWHLSNALNSRTELEFFTFRRLYPEFLYPGGTKAADAMDVVPQKAAFRSYSILSIYNPFSWIYTGMKISGDVVHAQFWSLPVIPVYLVIFIILKLRRKKIIITLHNVVPHEQSRLDRLLMTTVLKFGEKFIVHSHRNKQQLADIYQIIPQRIFNVPMGPQSVYFKDTIWNREKARKVLGIDENTKVLLLFGNIRDYKGVDDFITVCSLVKKRYSGSVVGLIVGQPWISFEKYFRQINAMGLKDDIKTFLKYIPDQEVNKYFYACDILLLPYKEMHGQSAVGNIAVALEIPVVATDVGGLPDLVLDKKSILAPEDTEGMANRVNEIITQKFLIEKLKRDAQKIKQQNSWECISQKTLEVYHSAGIE